MRKKYTTPEIPHTPQSSVRVIGSGVVLASSRCKAPIVTLLAWLLAWRPRLAMFLGRVITRIWPNFRRVCP